MRRTRIVATIGPACDDRSSLKALMEAGMDVCRLNYSHGEPDDKTELYLTIRDIEDELGRPTCILADLPGPKLRLGIFPDVEMLEEGSEITLLCGRASLETTNGTTFPVEYDGLSAELKTGDPILLSDGLIRLTVKSTEGKAGGSVRCVVEDGGPISSRKGVNVPGTLVDLPAIGPKDKAALQHALENGADYIAVSYVRTAEDLMPAKEAVEAASMHVPVLAKIEHPVALENLDSILDVADAVMVARGDLGVEIPLENVPVVQQRIIDKALERGMPVVVATQMLDSMTFQPRPTRAEVSDVSTAIRHGATGVMLSGETASGKFPLESVQTMARIAAATEDGLDTHELRPTALARFAQRERWLMPGLSWRGKPEPHESWWRLNTGPQPGWSRAIIPPYRLRRCRIGCEPFVEPVCFLAWMRCCAKNTIAAQTPCARRSTVWCSRGASIPVIAL